MENRLLFSVIMSNMRHWRAIVDVMRVWPLGFLQGEWLLNRWRTLTPAHSLQRW